MVKSREQKEKDDQAKKVRYLVNTDSEDLPTSVDWRLENAVTEIKDQLDCNSPYAHAAVGAVESARFIASKRLTPLSEQQVIDCSSPYGNNGCTEGNLVSTWQYIIGSDGIANPLESEIGYPYKNF